MEELMLSLFGTWEEEVAVGMEGEIVITSREGGGGFKKEGSDKNKSTYFL